MNRRNVTQLSVITSLTLIFLLGPVLAQQKSLKEQLIGTWIFVSSVDTNKEGVKSDRWGPNAKGLIIFEANGRYSFMISRSDIPKFAVNNVNQGTAAKNKAVVNGITAHFGTWSVDETTKTITTNVEASSFPNLNGGSQKRVISSLTPDELKYTNPSSTTGAMAEVVWKRVR
jgi:Lipocalin-like domain